MDLHHRLSSVSGDTCINSPFHTIYGYYTQKACFVNGFLETLSYNLNKPPKVIAKIKLCIYIRTV